MVITLSDVEKLKSDIRNELKVHAALDSSSMKLKRGLQHFLSLKYRDVKKQKLYELLLSYLLKSETLHPGGYEYFLKKFSLSENFPKQVKPRSKKQLIELLDKRIDNKLALSILKTALKFSSSETHFSIKKTSSEVPFIEIIEDYRFDYKNLCNQKFPIELFNAKIICIDGYIENVSEIHHLLEEMSASKVTCVLFVRGASNDVLHTIKINNERQTINAHICMIPFDLENVNSLGDIAIISNNDVISSLKGNLISTAKLENSSSVDACIIEKHQVKIRNRTSRQRVLSHVNHLRKMMLEKPESQPFLEKRISSLTSTCIVLALPDDINYYSNSQQLDLGIRTISSIMSNSYSENGTIDNLYESFQASLDNILGSRLL